ncbi:ATP-binding cassette domain-containing protein [Kiritimatiellaeota bacterium B1221]|nr:ATP-binding cassette domain-containing protein [Kiritimatiellaeota bacterium B1221]
MIIVQSLSRNYGDFKAVDEVSFEIKKGEVVGLLGHNGAGKTTIMKMLTGYLEPSSGSIEVDRIPIETDIRRIQSRIGYLPENCPVWPEMTVIDYLEYQAHLHGVKKNAIREAVTTAIRRTALKEKAESVIQTLSRGYRQRVGVAQAILHHPDIIILDEPTNGLDPTQIFQMRELIRDLAQTATVILSTHILQEVQAVCERVLIMREGKLVVDSDIKALQSGQQLRVSVDNAEAKKYLAKVEGVTRVEPLGQEKEISAYLLDCSEEAAPSVAAAVAKAGDKLFRLSPEVRNLETVFAEVNMTGSQAA